MAETETTTAPEKASCGQKMARGWSGFMRFMYKPETGQIMDRTPIEWLQLILYFLVFYVCLAGFFYANLRIFLATIHPDRPALTGTDNLLRLQPGIGFRPMPAVENTLIRVKFNTTNNSTNQKYIDDLNTFFDAYKPSIAQNYDPGLVVPPGGCNATFHSDYNRTCLFDVKTLGPCAPGWANVSGNDGTYGFSTGTPCVLLKLNRVFGWLPPLNGTVNIQSWKDISALNSNDPSTGNTSNVGQTTLDRWGLWATCTGDPVPDIDEYSKFLSVKDGVRFFPGQFFSPLFYPYVNQPGYVSPVVMVQFNKMPVNTAMMFECRLNGEGVNNYYDKNERMASNHFELVVENS